MPLFGGDISDYAFFTIHKAQSLVLLLTTGVGWIGNGLIIYATIKRKNLHNPCNILIAIQACSDIIIQMSHPIYVYFAWNEIMVSFSTCYYINFIFISCCDFSTLIVLFISLDRLVAAKQPAFYNTLNPVYYVVGVVSLCLTYCGIFKYLLYTSLTEEKTMCLIAESMTGSMTFVWFAASAFINLTVIAVYSLLARSFKASGSEYQKINKSLKTMITVHIFGWFLTMTGCSFSVWAAPTHRVFTVMEAIGGTGANVNIAAPFFIYYFRSTLYGEAFRKIFNQMGFKVSSKIPSTTSKVTAMH
ncbi:hypothetical protein L596_019608 [Steinernema carpocapsae]|uniref:G-protein coupled receptors family 1 profile domain-containing protein n=1 Tax=Steinernema carpocapsae TaxID=34508 RepID=A0A4U5MR81_STECR|nr:hypothetical protein L596_019608 [Steinernema carpocapsae]